MSATGKFVVTTYFFECRVEVRCRKTGDFLFSLDSNNSCLQMPVATTADDKYLYVFGTWKGSLAYPNTRISVFDHSGFLCHHIDGHFLPGHFSPDLSSGICVNDSYVIAGLSGNECVSVFNKNYPYNLISKWNVPHADRILSIAIDDNDLVYTLVTVRKK
jgi:hypothetical protein